MQISLKLNMFALMHMEYNRILENAYSNVLEVNEYKKYLRKYVTIVLCMHIRDLSWVHKRWVRTLLLKRRQEQL
jgi:hypothetical protein